MGSLMMENPVGRELLVKDESARGWNGRCATRLIAVTWSRRGVARYVDYLREADACTEKRGLPYPARGLKHVRTTYRNQPNSPVVNGRKLRRRTSLCSCSCGWCESCEFDWGLRGCRRWPSTVTEMQVGRGIALLPRGIGYLGLEV